MSLSIKRFKYNEEGLSRFFGPLEAKIMDLFWESEQEEFSIKEMQKALETEKNSNFNTVMTVMNRLVEKNVLKKRVSGRVSLFSPIQSKEEFFDEQSKKLTENLLDEFGGVVISHMIDSLTDVDESLLHKLEQKIQQLKKDKP
jgi:predicted transcriptional regulator